jgi:hypothetical protein
MNTKRNKVASIFTVVLLTAVLLFVWPPENASARSVLPDEVVVSDTFYPGFGSPVGQVQRVKGQVVGVHSHAETQGFRLRPKNMLYKNDTIYTMEKAKVRFRMNDGSILSLASETKLELNKSIYDKKKKSRSSFLNMAFGKARFLVVKLVNFKRSEFKVKTPTAVCGVRGSDYVIEVYEDESVFIALEKTIIEIYSREDPGAEPMVLEEYEKSTVKKGGIPSRPERLTPEEIQKITEPFISVAPGESEPEADEIQAGEGEGTGGKEVGMSDVLVPEDSIVRLPEDFEPRDVADDDIGKVVQRSGITEDRSSLVRDDIVNQINEDDEWPSDFPGNPEQ